MSALTFDVFWRDHGAQQGLAGLGSTADASRQKIEQFNRGMTNLGRMGATALVGSAAAAVGFGVKVASANEQARISFTTMLGSAQKAEVFLKDLQKFAASTPFEFPELQSAASSLISAGIEAGKVIPIMRTLGDVTSGMGTGSEGVKRATIALQQMSAAGRITGEDLNQLRDAGIPVFDLLAKATGKSKEAVVALAQAGKLGKKELGLMMQALESGAGLERFSGLMDKQSKSLAGMWSTIKDTFGQGMAEVIAPSFPLIKSGMESLTKSLEGMFGWLKRNQDALGTGLQIVIAGLKAVAPAAAAVAGVATAMWAAQKAAAAWSISQAVIGGLMGKSIAGLSALRTAFGGVAVSATAAGRAMKIAQLSIPVVGIALFAVTTALQFFASKSSDASAEADTFADSMGSVDGAVTRATAAMNENVRAQAVSALTAAGAFEQAKKLGLSLNTVTDAALGNKSALKEVNAVLGPLISMGGQVTATQSDQRNTARALATSLGGVAKSSIDATAAERDRRGAMTQSAPATDSLKEKTGALKDAQTALRVETQKVIDELTILRNGALSQDQANSAWEESIDDVTKSVKENGRSLAVGTEKGRANRYAIRDMITTLNDKVVADVKASGSTKNVARAVDAGRKDILKAATAAGLNGGQVEKMINEMVKTPKELKTTINTKDMQKVLDQIKDLQNQMREIRSKEVAVRVSYSRAAGSFSQGRASRAHACAEGGVHARIHPGPGRAPLREPDRRPAVAVRRRGDHAARVHPCRGRRRVAWPAEPGGDTRATVRSLTAEWSAGPRHPCTASSAPSARPSRLDRVSKCGRAGCGEAGGEVDSAAAKKAAERAAAAQFDVGGKATRTGSFLTGIKPVPGGGRRHSGYPWASWAGDFPVGMGTPIRAWKSGTVAATNYWNYSYGKHTRINHPGGQRTLYAHQSAIGVGRGDQVKAGQTIGRVGSTGNSTGPHLHFEVQGLATGGVMRRKSLVGMSEAGPERVLTTAQNRDFERLVHSATRMGGAGAVTIEKHYHFPHYVGSTADLKRALVDMDRRGDLAVIKGR